MRIAYLNTYIQTNHTGGGKAHISQFANNATALGHEIWSYPGSNHPDVQIIPTDRISHIKTMRQMDALYIRIERKSPGLCTWSLPPRRLLYGFPIVVWEFNTLPDEAQDNDKINNDTVRRSSIFRGYSRGCDLAICVSQALADIVQDKFTFKRILVVPNGSDPELFRPDVLIAKRLLPFQDKFNVVWIGTGREPWHDIDLLCKAAWIVFNNDKGQNINFHIIGSEINGVMAETPPNIYYWGAEYYDRLPNWLVGMQVGLHLYRPGPSDYNSPLKIFDYMASGLTVVGTQHPVINELADKLEQTDLIVQPGNSRMLAEVLIKLASDRERVQYLGYAGRDLVIKYYNWRRAVQDTMNEMEAILKKKGRVPKA